MATAFDVRLGSNEVSIYDEYSKKVNVYSSTGEFQRSFMTHDFARDMAVNSNGEYYFYDPLYEFSQYKRGLWKTDSLGNYLETLVAIDSKFKWSSGIQPKFFRHVEDTICIMGAEDKDLLFHIVDGKVEAPYHVKVDIEMSKRMKKKTKSEEIKPFDAYVKLGHQETSRFLFFSVCDYTLAARADIIHDKKIDKTYYMGERTIFDADNCLFFVPFMYSEKDRFMSVADITAFADYNDLKKIFPTISEQSNPIIIVYHTKK